MNDEKFDLEYATTGRKIYESAFKCGFDGQSIEVNPFPADDWKSGVWLQGFSAGFEDRQALAEPSLRFPM